MKSYEHKSGKRYQTIAVSALAALWLSACGGGGGDTVAETPASPPFAGGAPAPSAPATPPPPPPVSATAIAVTSNTIAEASRQYEVTATGATGVAITLPAQATVGQTVRVTGISASPWTLVPNAGQTIDTIGMAGNVAPGQVWTTPNPVQPGTTTFGIDTYHWVATNPTGSVLAAGSIPGLLNVSRNGGGTWSPAVDAVSGETLTGNWISIDMNASADRMIAVAFGGNMYRSIDQGLTWTQINSNLPTVGFTGREWESVTVSQIGQRVAAATMANANVPGEIVVSANGGDTWTLATAPTAAAAFAAARWRALDSSADGSVVVAASQTGTTWISDGTPGVFTPLVVRVGDTVVTDGWYRMAISADGDTIVVAGNEQYSGGVSTGLYVSRNRGQTWSRASNLTGNYTSVSVSADGSVIGATLAGANGQALLSRDGGQNFTVVTPTGTTETAWRNMALSADGNFMVLAAGTFFGTPGQLYTSLGNRTAYGALGAIGGGQSQSVEVTYEGNNRFRVTNSSGGAFSIR